jgi:AP-1 complex subunit sigma 1/2
MADPVSPNGTATTSPNNKNNASSKKYSAFNCQVNQLVITRKPKACNFVEYKDYKIVYKRYASLYFITIVDKDENELIVLELIQTFVEVLDKYFGNVCELDLIFNFHKVILVNKSDLLYFGRADDRGIRIRFEQKPDKQRFTLSEGDL